MFTVRSITVGLLAAAAFIAGPAVATATSSSPTAPDATVLGNPTPSGTADYPWGP